VTDRWATAGAEEFDVVSVAVGTALVSGGLAVVLPSLGALTVALAVLAWTGWLAFVRRTPRSLRQVVRGRVRWAILSSGAGALAFLLPLAGGLPFRPLVLALSLVPLWRVARSPPSGGS
jgi:hypothetical protein